MRYLYNILFILSTVLFFSCQEKDDLTGSNGVGYLRLTVASDASTTTRADIPEGYEAKQIAVQIIDSDGSVVKETDDWETWKNNPIELPAGNYAIKASSAKWDGMAAGFNAPYYVGSKDVKILGSQEVNAEIICQLANVKVTVTYDEELLGKVKNIATVVRSEDRMYSINFPSTEKRSAYYPVTSLVAEVTVITDKGTNTLTQTLGGEEGVQARDHYILDIHAQESGSSTVSVTVDPTTHEYSYRFDVSTVPTNGAITTTGTWETAAYLKAENLTFGSGVSKEGIKFQYRETASSQSRASEVGNERWIDVETTEKDGVYTALITNLTPGTDYEYRLVNETDVVIQDVKSFTTTGTGETERPELYNGDFEFWSQSGETIYPEVQEKAGNETAFWNTSNPGTTQGIGALGGALNPTTSVTSPIQHGTYAAQLKSAYKIIAFAAASLYTGNFKGLDGMSANMEFGKPFTGRPIALHGYYQYVPAVINHVDRKPEGVNIVSGETMDECSIFIALAKKSFTFNNNDESSYIDYENDENIIAYGTLEGDYVTFGETTNGYTEFTIPLQYKESQFGETPTHIIIVCSASKYGDYMTGGEGSTLYVDNFSLVYEGTPSIWENK